MKNLNQILTQMFELKLSIFRGLTGNGDNDVFIIFNERVSPFLKPGFENELSQKVSATIQVSYPTGQVFPQDYVFAKSVGHYHIERLPTIQTWRNSISEERMGFLKDIAGNEPIAEIGRYLNEHEVPQPVIAKMLLSAFEKIEARGIKTIFVFGTEKNLKAFRLAYKFTKIENFQYSVFIPYLNFPAELGGGAYHKVGSKRYNQMKEDLQKLALSY